MKNHKKIVAGLIAMASMMSSVTGITANANKIEYNDTIEAISASIEQELAAMAASSSSSYYANYDSYSTSKLSPTKHYLSVVAEAGQTLPFGNIYLYINMNAIPGVVGDYLGHLDSTRFITAAFYPNATISNIVGSDYTAQIKRISLYWNANVGTASRRSELFRYDLEHYSGTGIVNSEMALHRYTSQSPVSPTTITTTCGNDLKKLSSLWAMLTGMVMLIFTMQCSLQSILMVTPMYRFEH